MNEEQKAAFINAQAAMLNVRVAAMQAANLNAASPEVIPYKENDFIGLMDQYENTIGHNACIQLFHDLPR